jgi:7-cyano-7-deazaguanine synthase in queuosine biosynthesis
MKVEICMDPSKREKDGLLTLVIRTHGQEVDYRLDLPIRELYDCLGAPEPVTLDLLMISSLCYIIDKIVPRRGSPDEWTRELSVAFPVSSARIWQRVGRDLEKALDFLTGDIWEVSFEEIAVPFLIAPPRKRRRRRKLTPRSIAPTTVCLFSGGLDSLVGAIDLLSGGESVLLVGHYDMPGPASQQKRLLAGLQGRHNSRAQLLQVRVGHKPSSALELTLRCRSFAFLALGIYAARSISPTLPVYAPENGVIAVNIPLTPSRAGSCSTRTMHPFFLDRLGLVLRRIGIGNPIINPLQFKTKGECLATCADQDLLASLADKTVSCSHGTRKQDWLRKGAENCGYCVPCLFRRAALHTIMLDDGLKYGIDVCQGELPIDGEGDSPNDLRALADCARNRQSRAEISREILGAAPVRNLSNYTAVVERGLEEVRSLIRDKAIPQIQHAADADSPS